MEIRPILSALMRNKTGALLVAIQVALSLAILANALHIVNVRQAVAARPSGVADEASTFAISVRHLDLASNEEQLAIQARETAALRAVPGTAAVAWISQTPMSRSGSTNSVVADRKQQKESANAAFYVSPDSLVKAWGLKLVEGRDFLPEEIQAINFSTSDESPRTVIITKALADKMWPGAAQVVGKEVLFGMGEEARGARVVGVVERLQTPGAQVGDRGETSTIVPVRLTGGRGNYYTVRAEAGQRDRVMKEAEEALRKASSTPVVVEAKEMLKDRKERYRADVALSWMLISVSVLLLLITASGIVGMASLWVTQRRKQIGVRRALGARRIDILRYFLTENFMITSGGIAAGVLLAVGLNTVLVSKLELERLPVAYLLAGASVFWLLGVIAVYGPAWRAATISPALATRSA
jgi:putative ABC transport system permease protein